MDALGILPVTIPKVVTPQPVAPSVPQVPAATPAPRAEQSGDIALKAIDRQRYEAVQRAAEDIANVYVVSKQAFTIFKDATGQYVTRFRNLQDGKITYIPEPQLLRQNQAQRLLNITA